MVGNFQGVKCKWCGMYCDDYRLGLTFQKKRDLAPTETYCEPCIVQLFERLHEIGDKHGND